MITKGKRLLIFIFLRNFTFQYHASTLKKVQDLSEAHPLVDYTNPSLITLLFTDLGILTPSAVSDELIKLYLWCCKKESLKNYTNIECFMKVLPQFPTNVNNDNHFLGIFCHQIANNWTIVENSTLHCEHATMMGVVIGKIILFFYVLFININAQRIHCCYDFTSISLTFDWMLAQKRKRKSISWIS